MRKRAERQVSMRLPATSTRPLLRLDVAGQEVLESTPGAPPLPAGGPRATQDLRMPPESGLKADLLATVNWHRRKA